MPNPTWNYRIHMHGRLVVIDWDEKPPAGAQLLPKAIMVLTERDRAALELGRMVFKQMDNPVM